MSRPRRTTWSCSRSAASSAGASSGGGSWPASRRRSSSASAAGDSGGEPRAGGGRRRPAAGRRLGLRLAALQAREAGEQVAARAVAGRVGVEHDAAAERVGRRERADHEAVAARGHERLLEAELEVAAAELREPRGASRACRGGPRRACRRRAARRAWPTTSATSTRKRRRPGGAAPAATMTSPRATSSRATPARFSATRCPASARSRGSSWTWTERTRAGVPAGQDADLVAARGAARPQRAGDDGAGAADRERAVDVQPQRAGALAPPARPRRRRSSAARSAVEPLARWRRDRARSRRPGAARPPRAARARRVGEVGLRHRDHADRDPSARQHRRVLARLRHHAVVGGDDHQVQVDAGRPATIVRTKRSWPGRRRPTAAARRQLERRVAELDRDPARLLLRQPVGVHAGERAHEHGLAVIDVAGCAERQGLHALTASRVLPAEARYGGVSLRMRSSASFGSPRPSRLLVST